MPMGHTSRADEVRLLQHNLREPARSVDIAPSIQNYLLSMSKFANANYITILRKKLPQDLLASSPPPPALTTKDSKSINNVYKLKTAPELVRYYHATAGFPTQPTSVKAIKNKQYASWPGFRVNAVRKHFPELEEIWKGHRQKINPGLRSTR